MATSSLVAKLIGVAFLPILTRLYTPEDFGVVGIFSSCIAIILAFSTMRFDWLIPSADSRDERLALLSLGVGVLFFFSLLIFIIFFLFREKLDYWHGFTVLEGFLLWVPVAVFAGGAIILLRAWVISEGDLTLISYTTISESLTRAIVSLVIGVTNIGVAGLLIAGVLAYWVSLFMFIKLIPTGLSVFTIGVENVGIVFKKYLKKSLMSTTVSIVNVMYVGVIPILIIQYYSVVDLGYYTLMMSVAISPIGFITSSISQSFWAESAMLVKEDPKKLIRLYHEILLKLALLSLPVVIAALLAPYYIGLIFGDSQWNSAGFVLSALSPYLVGTIVFGSTNHLVVYGRQGYQLISDSLGMLLSIFSIIWCSKEGADFSLAIIFSSFGILFGYFVRYLFHLKANKEYCSNE